VKVTDCYFELGYNAFEIKAGQGELGREVNIPVHDVLFSDSKVINGHGVAIASEMAGGYFNITYRNLFLNGTLSHEPESNSSQSGMRIKGRRGTGGTAKKILIENIEAVDQKYGFLVDMFKGDEDPSDPSDPRTPVIQDVTVRNLRLEGALERAGKLSVIPESPLRGLRLENIKVSNYEKGWSCKGEIYGSAKDLSPPLPDGCLVEE